MSTKQLDARERRFVEEYLVDLDARRAALVAGYSGTMAASKAYQWVSGGKVKPHVYEAVIQAQAERAKRTGVTADKVITELAKLGFSDIRKAVRWQPNVTGMHEDQDTGETRLAITNEVALIGSDAIDDDTAAAIAEISQTDKGGLKLKLHDKRAALVDLGKHLGLFRDRLEVTGKDGAALVPVINVRIGDA